MKAEQFITLFLVVAIGYLLYLIMVPFWIPLFWAVVLTILFYPLYQWLRLRIRFDGVASFLTCIIITLFITIPVSFIGVSLVNEMLAIYEWADDYVQRSAFRIQDSPSFIVTYIKDFLDRYIDVSILDMRNIILKSVKEASSFLAQNVTGMLTNFTGFIFNIFLSLFAMFYLFKDGDHMVERLMEFLPLSEKDERTIFKKNREVIYATLYGGVLVALVQGCIGGITLWILGFASPVLWGTLMAVLSFIPMLGPPIIWVPASIFLIIQTSYIKAIILIAIGIFVIGLVDNLLRPIVVSGKTKIHPLLLFFSILGALKVLGFIGIIAGPIILSLSLAALDIYRASYNQRRGNNHTP
ncbi:MAG: AI-2E family transporter [Thermodesulfobacteriota bacterium]